MVGGVIFFCRIALTSIEHRTIRAGTVFTAPYNDADFLCYESTGWVTRNIRITALLVSGAVEINHRELLLLIVLPFIISKLSYLMSTYDRPREITAGATTVLFTVTLIDTGLVRCFSVTGCLHFHIPP